MGKAELTDPWGGKGWREKRERLAAASVREGKRRGQEKRFTGREVGVISAQDEWERVGQGLQAGP